MLRILTEQDTRDFIEVTKFERLHPKQLRWSKKDRIDFFANQFGHGVWLTTDDGILIGEILWSTNPNLPEWKDTAYIHGIAVAPGYQNKGHGGYLKAKTYDMLRTMGFKYVKGHAKMGISWKMSEKMGAVAIFVEEDFYKTGETYIYYVHDLNQPALPSSKQESVKPKKALFTRQQAKDMALAAFAEMSAHYTRFGNFEGDLPQNEWADDWFETNY